MIRRLHRSGALHVFGLQEFGSVLKVLQKERVMVFPVYLNMELLREHKKLKLVQAA